MWIVLTCLLRLDFAANPLPHVLQMRPAMMKVISRINLSTEVMKYACTQELLKTAILFLLSEMDVNFYNESDWMDVLCPLMFFFGTY